MLTMLPLTLGHCRCIFAVMHALDWQMETCMQFWQPFPRVPQ